MAVKISAKLPDMERNGLSTIGKALVDDPERRHMVIAIIDCASTRVDHSPAGPAYTPTAGILYIEPLHDPADVELIQQVFARVRAERMGEATLDLNLGLDESST